MIEFLIFALSALIFFPVLVQCTKSYKIKMIWKEKWKKYQKRLKEMEKDLMTCPRTTNEGDCNCEERIHGFVCFVRDSWVPLKREEINQKITKNSSGFANDYNYVEYLATEEYMPVIKKAMEKCLSHSGDPEKLGIYYRAHDEKSRYIENEGNLPRKYQKYFTKYVSVNLRLVPDPKTFWKDCEKKHETFWDISEAYEEGYILLKKRAGVPMEDFENYETWKDRMKKEQEEERKKRLEEWENKVALEKKNEEMEKLEKKSKEVAVEKKESKEEVEKIVKDKKEGEKSKVGDTNDKDKKEKSKENGKGAEGNKNYSKKTEGDTEKRRESKEDVKKDKEDGSGEKDNEDGSKKTSQKKSASNMDKEGAAADKKPSAEKSIE